jgi:hypothetical protein
MNKMWISFAEWYAMTPVQRKKFSDSCGGNYAVDLNDYTMIRGGRVSDRLSDYEEYQGEADSRGTDGRGFNRG